ncbi:nuclear transport factor 2 family protein [Nocardia amamiensis]|uniref:Nuclear transport factor 2 family protein n=1 Tax=Nocardia amamiensis TaxID=404578 RepID=A0ABS0CZ57_9NOCA|nr:nuclear transport factor 2 family protein [Nocardia amamiensis]MBF6301800.1 nuclear transport factor 2 family protein [Nocardia amamiensis]
MSEISSLADRLAVVDVITKMFVYTDQRRWEALSAEVFTPKVDFDGGFGGPVGERAAADIIEDWRTGLADLDGVHHQSGNHLIDLHGDTATVHADAIAVHVKNAAVNGKTRTFVGSYSIGTERTAEGWRVNRFHYRLKVIDGNADLT